MKFENTIIIEKPAAEVFNYLVNLEHLPDWNYAIKRTMQITPGEPKVGTRYTQERTLPRHMTEQLEIITLKPNSLLTISGGFGPFTSGTSTYSLEQIDSAKTLLRNTIHLQVGGALQLVAPLATLKIKAAVAQNLQALKQIVSVHRNS